MVFIITLVIVGLMSIYEGWVLSVIWNWFIPLIGGPKITIPVAIGLSLIVAMLVPHKDIDEDKAMQRVGMMLFMPIYCLVVAWVVHGFV